MAKIKILDDDLINKIAAGEVIERPASVVKELIENSLDSDATEIEIELREGGKSEIKITDNGKGMSHEDAIICTKRHATSKIKDEDDLLKILTLGFRGEALASISAVSNFKLISKRSEDKEAIKLLFSGSSLLKEEKIAAKNGTTIQVNDLFFNTPARKKHMKTISSELSTITDIVSKYALINYDKSFKLRHQDKDIIFSPKVETLFDNIVNLYGKDHAKQLLHVIYDEKIKISGYIGKPNLTRSDKSQQILFLNNRYIKNKAVSQAVYDAFHTLLFNNRHPIFILNIEIDPTLVDVNVHPQKTEVRLDIEAEIYEIIYEMVHKKLKSTNLVPEIKADFKQAKLSQDKERRIQPVVEKYVMPKNEQSAFEVEKESHPFRILGQSHNLYILVEDESGLMLVDQHAAEERMNYEKFMKQFVNKEVETQTTLDPIKIELNPKDSITLKDNLQELSQFGFSVEEFGPSTFLIRAMPSIFGRQQNKQVLIDMIDELTINKSKVLDIKERIITRMACRSSIKQGDRMELQEMYKLISGLLKCDIPFTCPHGRPTIIKMTLGELEKKFKRKA